MYYDGLCCVKRDLTKRQKRSNKEAKEAYPLSRHMYYDGLFHFPLQSPLMSHVKRAVYVKKRRNKEAYPLSIHMCNNGLCCIQSDTQKRLTKESFARQKRRKKEAHEAYPLSRHMYHDEMATMSRPLKL